MRAYLVLQLRELDQNLGGLLVASELVEPDLLLDQTAKQKRQEFLMISRVSEILAESLLVCIVSETLKFRTSPSLPSARSS